MSAPADEKRNGDEISTAPPVPKQTGPTETRNVLREKAAEFLAAHGHVTYSYDEEKRVLKKINWRVLPILLGSYFFQQLDKSALR